MTELLTAAQMRQIEQDAIESGDVTGLELMERAGRGVVEAVFEEWPELKATSHRAVVLCGPGNNGGDGFVMARLLKEWGWEVEVYLYGDADKLPPDAKVNYERWAAMGDVKPPLDLSPEKQFDLIETLIQSADPILFVDGVFGAGLTRPLENNMFGLDMVFQNAVSHDAIKRVAIDIPSGICTDSGCSLGNSFYAELTVSFHSLKVGHLLSAGAKACGKPVVKKIGLKSGGGLAFGWELVRSVEMDCDYDTSPTQCPKEISKLSSHHKYDHGHALVLSGGVGRGGAARMAARGALRIGAGLVTVICPPSALIENAAQLNAIMLRSVKDGDALAEVLQDARVTAVCVGPALGIGKREGAIVGAAVRAKHTPYVVLDADALTLVAGDAALFEALHDRCVLTPHAGEFARLFPDIAEKLNAATVMGPGFSKVDATREAAARAGCVVLFKGPDTVIAHPDGRCGINSAHYDRKAPWLATAGSGDVLAGFITGLLARGFEPMQAAEIAAWLHVECARSFGPGLIAEDLPEELPKVFRQLGL